MLKPAEGILYNKKKTQKRNGEVGSSYIFKCAQTSRGNFIKKNTKKEWKSREFFHWVPATGLQVYYHLLIFCFTLEIWKLYMEASRISTTAREDSHCTFHKVAF